MLHTLQRSCVTDIPIISTATQRNTLHLKFTSSQCRDAVVGTEMELRSLQLIADVVEYERSLTLTLIYSPPEISCNIARNGYKCL